MELGVADVVSLASPDPVSLAMNAVKLAAKVQGAYSARGGKLADFARFMQTVGMEVKGMHMAEQLPEGAVPLLTKLNATLEFAASKVERYQKRSTFGAMCRARSESARIQELTADINALLQQLHGCISARHLGTSPAAGLAQAGTAFPTAASAAAGSWSHLPQMAPAESPLATPVTPGVAELYQTAAEQQRRNLEYVQQLTQYSAAQQQESMAAVSRMLGGAGVWPNYSGGAFNQVMQNAAARQQQSLQALQQAMQNSAAQQQQALQALAQQQKAAQQPTQNMYSGM